MMTSSTTMTIMVAAMVMAIGIVTKTVCASGDHNGVFGPCSDAKIRRGDGFTLGIAFSSSESFSLNSTLLSPCDRRLSISSSGAQLAVFRPKVDEISLLTINTTTGFSPASVGGYMVAFAGRKYAARSYPTFVSNSSYTVTSFTLVLEFQKGTLQNLYWKTDGCSSCSGQSSFICLNKKSCAIQTSSCKSQGAVDCSIGIQLAFSGTDMHDAVLNSWYEVAHLQQYSLYGLYSNLRDSLTGQYNKIF
ncbi:uncharacterized protein [Typha angustifolia]|uniref:uncharacterized protein n=1 Tax=Typha angustifolia TaxID=59011 RepID=UPI003C306AE7